MDFCHCLSAAGGWFYQHALAVQTTMERERLEDRVESKEEDEILEGYQWQSWEIRVRSQKARERRQEVKVVAERDSTCRREKFKSLRGGREWDKHHCLET